MRTVLAALLFFLPAAALAQDIDGDGYPIPTDCRDTDPAIHPGAADTSRDGIDQDCNLLDFEECFVDGDGDGFGAITTVHAPSDPGCTGAVHSAVPTDCDDTDANLYPGSAPSPGPDTCDGVDDDCDGQGGPLSDEDLDGLSWLDEQALGTDGCLIDSDGDTVPDGSDCAPTDPAVHPGATEIPGDGIDQDCDGMELCYVDTDQDGVGTDSGITLVSADPDCTDPGESDTATDCDDNDPKVQSCPGTTTTPTGTTTPAGTTPPAGTATGGTPGDSGSGPDPDKGCSCAADPGTALAWPLLLLPALVRRRP